MRFRKLNANEIDVRIGQIGKQSVTLLLYKNARIDMQLLDETVGSDNWQREHYECKGNLFCRVGIYTNDQWVWKADCGTESYTEKEKGESSDSFKRACTNWGIGRELYTAPRIYVKNDIAEVKDGKCYTRFKVTEIGYDDDGNINRLTIAKLDWNDNETVVYTYGNVKVEQELKEEVSLKTDWAFQKKVKSSTLSKMTGKTMKEIGKDFTDLETELGKKLTDEEKVGYLDKWLLECKE